MHILLGAFIMESLVVPLTYMLEIPFDWQVILDTHYGPHTDRRGIGEREEVALPGEQVQVFAAGGLFNGQPVTAALMLGANAV